MNGSRRSFEADQRRVDDIVAQMGRVAARLSTSRSDHFVEKLFTDDAKTLRDASEPSSALLMGVAGLVEGLIDRFNELPERARETYFLDRLGIRERTQRPDRAYVTLTGTPSRLPVVVDTDTPLTVTSGGEARSYALHEPMTVARARLGAVVSYGRFDDGRDLAAARPVSDGGLEEEFFPFGTRDELGSHSIPRALFIASDYLSAGQPGVRLTVRFRDVEPSLSDFMNALGELHWSVTTEKGWVELEDFDVRPSGRHDIDVVVELPCELGCAPLKSDGGGGPGDRLEAGSRPAIRLSKTVDDARLAGAGAGAVSLMRFADVELFFSGDVPATHVVAAGSEAKPGEPFEAFGDPAQVGAMLHVAVGTLFNLPLEFLELNFVDAAGGARVHEVAPLSQPQDGAPSTAAIVWESARSGGWVTPRAVAVGADSAGGERGGRTKTLGGLAKLDLARDGMPFSLPVIVQGKRASWLRLRLEHGDFGWTAYEHALEEFSRSSALRASRIGLFARIADSIKKLSGDSDDEIVALPARPRSPRLSAIGVRFRSERMSLSSEELELWTRSGVGSALPLPTSSRRSVAPFRSRLTDSAGALFIGLRDVDQDVQLSLFVDVQAATAEQLRGRKVEFEYLANDAWKAMAVSDGTNGLTQSGIIKLHPAPDWRSYNGRLPVAVEKPNELWWLRVTTDEPASFAIRRLSLNAAVMNLVEGPTSRGLENGASVSLGRPVPGINGGAILGTARGGVVAETTSAAIARAGRIVRHRARAISDWDVEAMLLDAFPQLSLVRCARELSRGAPGTVDVVAIPDTVERFPILDAEFKEEIRHFLDRRTPVSARVTLHEPYYLEVNVVARIRIQSGVGPTEAKNHIEKLVNRKLHPRNSAGGRFGFQESLTSSWLRQLLESFEDVREVLELSFAPPFEGLRVIHPRSAHGVITAGSRHAIEVIP